MKLSEIEERIEKASSALQMTSLATTDLPWAVSEIRRLRGLLKEARAFAVQARELSNAAGFAGTPYCDDLLSRIDSALKEDER